LAQIEAMIDLASQGQGRWLLQDHPWQRNEYALAGRLDGRLVQGVIDRCFVSQEGELWLVDYKTNQLPPDMDPGPWLSSMEQHYRPQMDRYAQLLLGTQPEHAHCHCALYMVATDSLRSWRFPA
jgi:ATP-dependent exoDNAse (exonuclease V) beta subunit